MKPINNKEIRLSLLQFVFHFLILLLFSLFCVFFFIQTFDEEYQLLKERNDEIENLISSRMEINQHFSSINKNFKNMGIYSNSLADIAKKRILQMDIAKSSAIISSEIAKMEIKNYRPSVSLYKKMNNEVSNIARLQDSLYTTKNFLESKRTQLKSCLDDNARIQEEMEKIGIKKRNR